MSFRLVKSLKEVDWPVTVNVPVNGGKTEQHEFTAKFKLMSQEEYDKALQGTKNDTSFIAKFLIGWSGLLDDDDKEVPFSKEALKNLCGLPFVRVAIVKAYNQAITGQAAKN